MAIQDQETVGQWLNRMANTNQSDDYDDRQMQYILRKVGISEAVCTCGLVYLTGYGIPADIHSIAKMILDKVGRKS